MTALQSRAKSQPEKAIIASALNIVMITRRAISSAPFFISVGICGILRMCGGIVLEKKDAKRMEASSLRGQLLLAMPEMHDKRFQGAVVLLCIHDKKGAMGLILNKPLDSLPLSEIVMQLDLKASVSNLENLPVYYGGPVEIGRGFVVHSSDYESEHSQPVTKHISLASHTQIIEDKLNGCGPRDTMIALGYAGWSPGQLERELAQNAWLILPTKKDDIFKTNAQDLWLKTLESNRIRPENLSSLVGHA